MSEKTEEEPKKSFAQKTMGMVADKVREQLYDASTPLRGTEEVTTSPLEGVVRYTERQEDEARVCVYMGGIMAFLILTTLIAFYFDFNRGLVAEQDTSLGCPNLDTQCLLNQQQVVSQYYDQLYAGAINSLQCDCLTPYTPPLFNGVTKLLSVANRCASLKPKYYTDNTICTQLDDLIPAAYKSLHFTGNELLDADTYVLSAFRLYAAACGQALVSLKAGAVVQPNPSPVALEFWDILLSDLQTPLTTSDCELAQNQQPGAYFGSGKFCDRVNAMCFGAEGGEGFVSNVGCITSGRLQFNNTAFGNLASSTYIEYLRNCKTSTCTWFREQNTLDVILEVLGEQATILGAVMVVAGNVYTKVAAARKRRQDLRKQGEAAEGKSSV